MISFSDNAVTISETLQTNAIVWIHSLLDTEMGPTRRIIEDLEILSKKDGLPIFEYSVNQKSELNSIFNSLIKEAEKGLRPVLHVDAHGSESEGLLLAKSGERVAWGELSDLLRALNVATANNLTCVFALCFGLHLYKQVSISKPVPAYLFFAPSSEVNVGFLEAQTLKFYQEIIHSLNVTDAFEKTLGEEMEGFHCQGLFMQSLANYIRDNCMGKGRKAREENIVTEIIQQRGILNPSSTQLKTIRRKIREELKPGQHIIDQFAPKFLIDRSPAFNFEELDKFVKKSSNL